MKVQKRIYRMTDRELRAYRRQRRQRRQIRNRLLIAALSLCIILGGALSYRALRSSADTGAGETRFKYYTNVSVAYGETLWKLAEEYMDEEMYKDKSAYISEVVSINHLENSDSLKEGQYLIVPYYSTDFVK